MNILYSADPDQVYVSIHCTAQSHAEEPWMVATMLEAGGEWHPDTWYWRDGRPAVRLSKDPSHRVVLQAVSDDRHVPRTEWEQDPGSFEQRRSRQRYVFKCGRCDLTHVVGSDARREKMFSMLGRMADAGVREVSLDIFAALLSK